ncbi:MAG: flagellar motor switch protein FliG [Deltaproteobacteria bacterium]|jgi:flagellar motor switch protein FliG|nr:MAG: flagellar motor switch protein FliG [Deltaproteobacteria bacterium]
MATERLSGPQKAALFLYLLGEDFASEIVRNLDEEEIQRLGASISKILSISPKTADSLFTEFQHLASTQQAVSLGAGRKNQFIKSVFSKALEVGKAESLYEKVRDENNADLFKKVRKIEPKTLAPFLQNEHPQTLAIVIANLEAKQAAAILAEFPPPLQSDILFRITQLENIPPGILEEIDQTLEKEISHLTSSEGKKYEGVRTVADILNQMDASAENDILQGVEGQKQGLADEIRRLMFIFEDLLQVDDRSLMALLKDINSESLKVALKTASEELKEKIFKNMSERAAQLLKEDLEVMGPARLKDVEAAQQAIIQTAKKLESEGKVVLGGKGKEEAFV